MPALLVKTFIVATIFAITLWFAALAINVDSPYLLCKISSKTIVGIETFVRNNVQLASLGAFISEDGLEANVRVIPPIVFVSRKQIPNLPKDSLVGIVPGMGPLYRTVKVGGTLHARESDGRIRMLTDGKKLFDVSDPKVSWDDKRIVFAGVEHPDSNWRIYEIRMDGSGLRKITHTDRAIDLSQFGAAASRFHTYDDIDPCYLPDGRIVFSSTRFPAVAEYGDVLATNLFVVNPDGYQLHRITTERNGAEQPTIDPITGRIVYSRWWLNIDRPSNVTRDGLARDHDQIVVDDAANLWHTITITPDGDDMKLYAGDTRTREGAASYRPLILPDGKLVSIYASTMSLYPTPGVAGIRWFRKGADVPRFIIGAKPTTSVVEHSSKAFPPYAIDPVVLPDGRLLISYAPDGIDYGLYLCNFDGSGLRRVIDFPRTSELNADVVVARTVPPILQPRFEPPKSSLPPTEDPSTFYTNESFRFDCLNIFANADVDVPIPHAPPITRNASIQFFLNFQRQNLHGLDPSILVRVAHVYANGGVHEHDLPADVPMFEQVVDSLGDVIVGRDGKAAHVTGLNFNRAGTGTKCVGCHAGHTLITVPKNYSDAEWTNVSPSANVSASSVLELEGGAKFSPEYIIDRKVLLSNSHENWVANASENHYIELTWNIPIEVKTIVLYNIQQNSRHKTTISVKECEVIFFLGNDEVHRVEHKGSIHSGGTRITVAPYKIIDRIRVNINKVTGQIEGRRLAGLAEIETIARIVP